MLGNAHIRLILAIFKKIRFLSVKSGMAEVLLRLATEKVLFISHGRQSNHPSGMEVCRVFTPRLLHCVK